MKHINVSNLVKEKGLYEQFDEEWQSYNVDEDKVRPLRPFVRTQRLIHTACLFSSLMSSSRSPLGVASFWTGTHASCFPSAGQISSSCYVAITRNFGIAWKRGEWKQSSVHLIAHRILRFCRGYPLKKIQENNEAEIMEVVLDEARSSYAQEIVVELQSEGTEDLESNVARIVQWIEAWQKDRGHS